MATGRPEDLIPRFKFERLLNQDQGSRRISLFGSIENDPALLIIERAALPTTPNETRLVNELLTRVSNLGANDIYHWYMADFAENSNIPGLKLNLITPCTDKHIKKYSPQKMRVVTETPEIFNKYVRPFMERDVAEGRINWVYNIIDGIKEQEDIILRQSNDLGKDPEGFLLLPDMNWDRKTTESLRILGLVERRDLLSLRDLKKKDLPWLRTMHNKIVKSVAETYGGAGVEEDMLKVYMHYQPTYYHFHIHIVSVDLEPNATQAVGKAFSLPNLIAQLASMPGGLETGMSDIDLTYTLGENHELWTKVFEPLKKGLPLS